MAHPNLAEFQRLAQQYDLVPVYRRLLSDSATPVSALKSLRQDAQPCALFESVIGGEKVGRYSLVAAQPKMRFVAYRDQVELHREGDCKKWTAADPLSELEQLIGQRSVAPVDGLPPFAGGAIGYAGYDVVRYVEHLPNAPKDDRGLPDLD
ncbi:MAG: anthranilate synthase component I, partial [Pirellulaceae bacterium]